MAGQLLVGVCEVDITPPVGTAMCGSLAPRPSVGVEDPLYAKAIVLESEGTRLAYVILDIVALERKEGDEAVRQAAARTGIPADHIVWACSHTHTGPYTCFEEEVGGEAIDREWLAALPGKFALAVAGADDAKRPAHASRARGYCHSLAHNRRNRYKDGRDINTWLEGQGEDVQCVSAAGLVDPEVGVLSFEDEDGLILAAMFHFTLHANTNFGRHFSGDYPAVVASRMRERFGPQVSTFYVPGACGDQNVIRPNSYRQTGDILSEVIFRAIEGRRPLRTPVLLGARKRDLVVPFHDINVDQEARIEASQWSEECKEFFRNSQRILRERGETRTSTVLQAWHVGEVSFASLPGEPFIEWGIRMKRDGPFPWTFPVELGGDYVGYLVTRSAWEAGGYESLVACTSKVSPAGVETMLQNCLEMLGEMHTLGLNP